MKTEQADRYRDDIIALLAEEKLPVADLPPSLENFFTVVIDDKLTGVAGLEMYGKYGVLRSLAVTRNFRNRGIAGKLLSDIERLAASKKIVAIYLFTETAADYFIHKGYHNIARADVPPEVQGSSEFSHVCPQSAIVMRKEMNRVK